MDSKDGSALKHPKTTHRGHQARTEVGIKLLLSRDSPSAAAQVDALPKMLSPRSASLETRHACAVPRTGAPYKCRATGDTVTKWERAVRGHLNKLGVDSAWSAIVIAQLATCPLHLECCCSLW